MLRRWRGRLLAGVVIVGVVLRQCVFPGAAFDALRWQADVMGGGDRFAMADRFVARGGLLGKSREEVIRALGPSMEHNEFREWGLIYYLGPERCWICLGSEYLLLRLAADRTVCECRIMSDG